MKIKLSRSYKKKDKNGVLQTVFVYQVTGTEQAIAEFKSVMGDNFRESEEGIALWFTTRCVGNAGNLIVTSAGKVVADMSQFDQAASLASQYGGNLGLELAKHAAAQLMGNDASVATSAPVAKVESVEKL